MKKLLLALACVTFAGSAFAASPWDGTWKLDRSKSHFTGDSFTYTKTPAGLWHVAFGDLGYDFALDGKPYPAMDADHVQIAVMKGDHEIDYTNQFKGKTVSTMKETLSADGATVTDEIAGTHADGSTYTTTEISKRSGTGTGFLGKWVSTKENSNSESVIMISTAADGTVTFNHPITKSALVTKMDGTPATPTSARPTAGVLVTYKKVSATRADFSVTFQGKKVEEGYDELAADGKSWSETEWAPGKMNEKTFSVYVKQ